MVVAGALNIGAFFAFLLVAAYRLPGGVAATLGALQPMVVAGLASVLPVERLSRRVALSAAAGVAGVALLVLRADARLDAPGILAAAGGAVVMGTGVVLSKRWRSSAPLLATTGWQLVAGGMLLPVAVLVEGAPPASYSVANVAGFAYLTLVGTALAYSLWFRGLRALPATDVTFLSLLSPVVATAVGWAALGQNFTALQVLGGLVVLASLAAPRIRTARRRPRAAPAPAAAGPGPVPVSGGSPSLVPRVP